MHSTSVPQDSHWKRLPSWFAIVSHLLLLLHRLAAARKCARAALGHDHLGVALATHVPFAYLICHAVSLRLSFRAPCCRVRWCLFGPSLSPVCRLSQSTHARRIH